MRRPVFHPAARYPADPRAVFILALSVFSGIVAMVLDAGPESLEALLPHWGVLVWGGTLSIGSAVTLIGISNQSDGGIITEQIGSVMVGVACTFYSVLIFNVVGSGASQPVGIILAWGLACFVRWAQLQLLIRQNVREKLLRDAISVTQGLASGREGRS